MAAPRLLYLNALFDLELGGFPAGPLKRGAAEMTALFAACGAASDVVLLDVEVPDEYQDFLETCGLACPAFLRGTPRCAGRTAVPWGWNTAAVARLRATGAACEYPDLETVRAVNSRLFGHELCSRLGLGVARAAACDTVAGVERELSSRTQFPVVIKPAFGNAGYGFLRKQGPCLTKQEYARVETLIERCGGVTMEPWLARIDDISSRATVGRDGTVSGIAHHRCHANASGAFFADLLEPEDPVVKPWRDFLTDAVRRVGGELHRAGYFGPAGFDSFTWRDDAGAVHLASVIEINARHAMSSVAYALRERLAPGKACYFRFAGRRRHVVPARYDEFRERLGGDLFCARMRTGVLPLTPLRVRHDRAWTRPLRSAFFLAADTADSLMRMDARLRSSLGA
ncbi:MAG: hypothetical protein GF418_02240 [Chitinivibrionales bacterium]|nr:hypothetical protein [Chitinivibrionales bacterium]MBD3394421.1 hypothetical protein [Chitinivibrionales bacterium]